MRVRGLGDLGPGTRPAPGAAAPVVHPHPSRTFPLLARRAPCRTCALLAGAAPVPAEYSLGPGESGHMCWRCPGVLRKWLGPFSRRETSGVSLRFRENVGRPGDRGIPGVTPGPGGSSGERRAGLLPVPRRPGAVADALGPWAAPPRVPFGPVVDSWQSWCKSLLPPVRGNREGGILVPHGPSGEPSCAPPRRGAPVKKQPDLRYYSSRAGRGAATTRSPVRPQSKSQARAS